MEAAILLVIGVVVGRLVLEGGYLAYVKPSLLIPLLLTSLALVGLCIAALRRRETDEPGGHSHAPPKTGLLLLAPILAIVLVAPDPLGAYAVNRGSINSLAEDLAKELPPLEADGTTPTELSISEFILRTFVDGDVGVEGRAVHLTGFVVTDGRSDAIRLSRFAISCCAADASPRQVVVTEIGAAWEEDTWVEVTGVWEGGFASEEPRVPTLRATKVEPIPAPSTPYEFATY